MIVTVNVLELRISVYVTLCTDMRLGPISCDSIR